MRGGAAFSMRNTGGLNGPEGGDGEKEQNDRRDGVAAGGETLLSTQEGDSEIAEPDEAGNTQFKNRDEFQIFQPKDGAEAQCCRQHLSLIHI